MNELENQRSLTIALYKGNLDSGSLFAFMFMHLADAFIQIHLVSSRYNSSAHWNRTLVFGVASVTLYWLSTSTDSASDQIRDALCECMWTLAWVALQSDWLHTQVMKPLRSGIYRDVVAHRREGVWAPHALGRAACRWAIEGVSLLSRSALSERGRKASAVDPSCAHHPHPHPSAELLTWTRAEDAGQTKTKQHRLNEL